MKKKTNIVAIILSVIIILILVIIGTGIAYFYTNTLPVDSSSSQKEEFVVENGWTAYKIIGELEKQKFIKNSNVLKLYVKITKKDNFLAGTYNISKDMNAFEIVDELITGTSIKNKSITIKFVEGKRYSYYLKKIAENFDYTYDELYKLTTSTEYLDKLINNYWFIDSSILNSDIKYPLEGYLFPDTYSFNVNASKEEIIETLINEMDKKLSIYKDEISLSGKSVHSLLTLASMVELEAVTPEDRVGVAAVFNNRLKINMALGSDVTTYYAVDKEMTQGLYKSDLNTCSAYNTRGTCAISGLPVGPIASPSLSSIVAAINPGESEYYYFVADKHNKVYFSKSSIEQANVIADLKRQNIWPE